MKTLRHRTFIFFIVLIILGLAVTKPLVHLLTEIWWFDSVRVSEVFWTRLSWQVLLWGLTFVVYFLVLWGNCRLAMRSSQHFRTFENFELNDYIPIISTLLATVVCGFFAWIAASITAGGWETVLKFLKWTPFNSRDPIFQHDISFYIFQLPLYEGIHNWLFGLLLASLILSGVIYSFKVPTTLNEDWRSRPLDFQIGSRAKVHLSILFGAIALVMSWGFWLNRYQLLTEAGGVVFGAGYTDVHARIFAYSVLSLLAVGVAILFILSARRRSFALPLQGVLGFVVVFVLVNVVYPGFLQQFIVAPNELAKEKPYLEHNIQLTQAAYHLQNVKRQGYAAEAKLDRTVLQANQPTIRNIRLWDYRPLLSTYKQLQEIRLYYNFRDVDIDRYKFNNDYQQVMLSARELSYERLPQEAKTWVNQRLKYTHGYGLVMSPVNKVTADGLPELFIKNIPPVSSVNVPIRQPAIYYGEETNNYIFTGTTTDEFDYPQGDTNALARYSGKGGVPIPTIWHRLAYAFDRSSLQILISNYFTNQSRIHYYRTIQERVNHIAPFLRFDSDPYLAIIDRKLQWIVDAYTVSDRYPYSEPVMRTRDVGTIFKDNQVEKIVGDDVNYIRNSVKVLIDAYDGTVRFFVVDETDPVLSTYRQIFPHLFEAQSAIPADVKAHFRYPEDLFRIQAQMYLAYHMSNPEVFYNREDLWRFPMQTYEGNEVVMEPYYVIMQLPDGLKEEFLLILPFTPANKDNMTAWMAARSNSPDYGKLLLYDFPKQKLIYGPRQIEARIDQTPQISQQLTLWSQSGSKVIRGDLLVIPIGESLLYIEPLYLRAEQGELPELKRVIVAYDKAIVMEETLEQSLAAIFGGEQPSQGVPQPAPNVSPSLVQAALGAYQKAQNALRQGNWGEYGRYQQELEKVLQQLNQPTAKP
jgi:uncharacterized protein